MEDVAMNGEEIEAKSIKATMKAKKAERARLKHLEKIKRKLRVDDAWSGDPIEPSELAETLIGMVEAVKDPLLKEVLGKKQKAVINGLIDAAIAVRSISKVDVDDVLAKV